MEATTIKCSKCGKEHGRITSNCCWIYCGCGTKICGGCGGVSIGPKDMPEDDDDARYWCCLECEDCGLQGCGMCQ